MLRSFNKHNWKDKQDKKVPPSLAEGQEPLLTVAMASIPTNERGAQAAASAPAKKQTKKRPCSTLGSPSSTRKQE